MGIGPLLGIPERQLSLGQKMRCNIAAAFLHNPEIVYLDEPTIGLDSESKASIRECIRRMNEEEKTTFIVTSHDFQDIETLCRRIILINHGRVVVDDDMQKVKLDFNREKRIQFEVDSNPWYHKGMPSMEGVRITDEKPHSITLEYDVEKVSSIHIMQQVSKCCEIIDDTDICIGDGVMIGPNVTIATAAHPLDAGLRRQGMQMNRPVTIGSGAWIGAGVIILPGVTIGENTTIGAGSVVTNDIPADVVAYGNPCRVRKELR